MGSERASDTRKRESGKVCWKCNSAISAPPSRTERLCPKCYTIQPRHRVLMTFQHRDTWTVTFLEADCKTPVGRRLSFANPDKIIDLAKRGGVTMNLEARQGIEHGISIGRGGVWLFLTPEQYAKLKR